MTNFIRISGRSAIRRSGGGHRRIALGALCLIADPVSSYAAATKAVTAEKAETVTVRAASRAPLAQARRQIDKIPGGASIIDSREVERSSATSAKAILDYQPGVFVQQTGGNSAIKVSIRGSGLSFSPGNMAGGVKYLLNGLALSGPGGASYEFLEPLGISYTEVLRGANAFSYGAAALGGAINFVDKTGRTHPGNTVHMEGGSFGYIKGQLATGRAIDNFDYYVNWVSARQVGFQQQTFNRSNGISANFGYRFSPSVENRLYVKYRWEFHQNAGTLTRAQIETDPSQTSAAYRISRSNTDKYGSAWLGDKTTWHIDKKSDLEVGLVYSKLPQNLNTLSVQPGTSSYRDFSASIRYHRSDTILGLHDETELGWFWTQHLRGVTDTYQTHGSAAWSHLKGNSYNGSFDNVFALGNSLDVTPKLRLSAGVSVMQIHRYANITYSQTPNLTGYPSRDNYTGVAPAPRFGLTYQVHPILQLFGNISRSVDPAATWQYSPSTYTANQNYVRPLVLQTGTTVEGGLKINTSRFEGSVALYRSWIRHEILPVQLAAATSTSAALQSAFNSSPTIHQGIEAGMRATIWQDATRYTHRFSVKQSYTYNNFYFRHDSVFGHNQLASVPRHYYQSELSYDHRLGFYAGFTTTVASSYFADYANTLKAPAYAVFGVNLGYNSPDRKWAVYVTVNNLTDKKYAQAVSAVYKGTPTTQAFYPGDGRAVFGGATYNF